jgi:hypothetical protein
VFESRELAIGERPWRPDLDQLHLAAVFPAAVREPALHVRSPGDQHITVPEAYGLPEPTADVGTEIGHGALETELAADLHVTKRVVRATEELHATRDDHHIELAWTAGT